MVFDINEGLIRARQRLGTTSTRRRRSDAGHSRLPAILLAELRAATIDHDRPSMRAIQVRLAEVCVSAGLKPPSRACLYNALARIEGRTHSMRQLPPAVVDALYNLAPDGTVPGYQVAFYCFNYGSLPALSFAAGLPWLDLYQALRVRGWRPRSRGLVTAVMRARGLT
jgi:hypothetical protein